MQSELRAWLHVRGRDPEPPRLPETVDKLLGQLFGDEDVDDGGGGSIGGLAASGGGSGGRGSGPSAEPSLTTNIGRNSYGGSNSYGENSGGGGSTTAAGRYSGGGGGGGGGGDRALLTQLLTAQAAGKVPTAPAPVGSAAVLMQMRRSMILSDVMAVSGGDLWMSVLGCGCVLRNLARP